MRWRLRDSLHRKLIKMSSYRYVVAPVYNGPGGEPSAWKVVDTKLDEDYGDVQYSKRETVEVIVEILNGGH